MPNKKDPPSLSLTPRAQRLVDSLADLGRAISLLEAGEETPTDAQIGREIFSRTITSQSESGAVFFDPALLTTFSSKEIRKYAEAIEASGGSVHSSVTAWQTDTPAAQALSTFTYFRLPSHSTFPLESKKSSFPEQRPAIRKRLKEEKENLVKDLQSLIGESTPWANTLATTTTARSVAQMILASNDQQLLGGS